MFQTVLLGATQHQIATKSSVPFIQPIFPHTHNALVYTHCFHFLVLCLLIELYVHHSVYMRSMVTGLKNVYILLLGLTRQIHEVEGPFV